MEVWRRWQGPCYYGDCEVNMFKSASYRCLDPLTLLMIGGTLYEGYSANQQGKEQQGMYQTEAATARAEAGVAADEKAIERRKMMATQRMAYLANGATIVGTPAIVGQDTYNEYQKEINSIYAAGEAQGNKLEKQGANAVASGRTKLITSLAMAGAIGYQAGAFKSTAKTGAIKGTTTKSSLWSR